MSDPSNRRGDHEDGATALSEEDRKGLRLSWVGTRDELNAAEASNIARALASRRWRKLATVELLDDINLRKLHRDMFATVWSWAGRYRTTQTNIGCDPLLVATSVRDLCGDARVWFDSSLATKEAACRFHHRLVAIHPFVNGNGRHARALTDLLLESVGDARFTWGGASLLGPSEMRRTYVEALRCADKGDLEPLMNFVRS